MRPSETDLTTLLHRAEDPTNGAARTELYNRVEVELRRIAYARRAEQPLLRSVETTELIAEAWEKLVGDSPQHWHDRRHFFATVSLVIQNRLIDHFRRRRGAPRRLDSDLLRKVPARECDGAEAAEQCERYLALFE